MINKSRDEVAYNLIDIESQPSDDLIQALEAIDGVIKVRASFKEWNRL
jgi:D-3-phosphoglycerate dehydrogenase